MQHHLGDDTFFHTQCHVSHLMYILRIWAIYLEKSRNAPISVLAFYASSQHQLSKVPENKGLHLEPWMRASMLFEMLWGTQDTHGVGRYHIGPMEAAAGDMETMQDTPGCLKWYSMPKHKHLNQVLNLLFILKSAVALPYLINVYLAEQLSWKRATKELHPYFGSAEIWQSLQTVSAYFVMNI